MGPGSRRHCIQLLQPPIQPRRDRKETTNASAQATKDETISGLIEARGKILDAVALLSPAQRDEVFLGSWSVRDLLAHLVGWDVTNLEAAKSILAAELPSFYNYADRDWQTYNAHLVAEHKKDDFAQLLGAVEDSHRTLIAFLKTIPAGEFDRDHGIRFKGYKVTIARLMRAEARDELIHHQQVEQLRGNSKS